MKPISRGILLLALVVLVSPKESALSATVNLTVNTVGSGSITRNPSLSSYPNGSVVTLTATPASGWLFGGWSSDISGALNPTNLLMDADKVITANFSKVPDFNLIVNLTGAGSVDPSSGSFPSNTVVVLTATPSNGWMFLEWAGAAAGRANPLHFTMKSSTPVQAIFVQLPAFLAQPSGGAVHIGDSFSFSANATGNAPLTYQWFFNSHAVPNAISPTFTVTNVQPKDGGAYRVVVSNSYGTGTSTDAVLTVNCPGTNVVSVANDMALRAAMAVGGNVRLCFSGTVTLTNTIHLEKDVTLDARGTSVTISGGGAVRLFNVNTGVVFQATNVVFADGFFLQPASAEPGDGGAINNKGGTVRLVSCMLSNHFAIGGSGNNVGGEGRGGAIYNEGGTVELYGSVLATNYAMGGSAGSGTGTARGGAIHSVGGTVLIQECNFLRNVAFSGVGVTSAIVQGGAIYLDRSVTTIRDCQLTENKVATLSNSDLSGLTSVASVFGGALFVQSGTAAVSRVKFLTNTAISGNSRSGSPGQAQGGAVWNGGTLTIETATLAGGMAQGGSGTAAQKGMGGAIYNAGSLVLQETDIVLNRTRSGDGRNTGIGGFPGSEGMGGGIFNSGALLATNCTVASNSVQGGASGSFGSADAAAFGGGVFAGGGSTYFMNVTMAGNTVNPLKIGSSFGPPFGANIVATNSSVTLRNTLVAGTGTNANIWGAVIDGGYNMCSDGSAHFNSGTSFNFTDPKLLPLADNGGPSPTMALALDSPAIDFGTQNGAPSVDQRGSPRPSGAGVDIGAYETGALRPILHATRSGNSLTISFQAEAGVTYDLWKSSTLPVWQIIETIPSLTAGAVSRTYPMTSTKAFYRLSLH